MARKNEVTGIRVNVRRPDRRSIHIDGEYAFSVSEGIFLKHAIKVGDRLTDRQMEALVAADEYQKIKDAALILLSYRPRSIRELRDRLLQKGWGNEQIESVIRELQEKDYLNDLEFSRLFARDRIRRKYLGPRGLRYELVKAGIDKETIEDVVNEAYRKNPPESLIESLLEKRGIDVTKPLEAKDKTRIVNLLRRKGFAWNDMERVISRLKTH